MLLMVLLSTELCLVDTFLCINWSVHCIPAVLGFLFTVTSVLLNLAKLCPRTSLMSHCFRQRQNSYIECFYSCSVVKYLAVLY